MYLSKSFIAAAALLTTSSLVFLQSPTQPAGPNDQPDIEKRVTRDSESLAYRAGQVAGEITSGYKQGADGMPSCYEVYYADIRYNPETCRNVFFDLGNTVGFNVDKLLRGFSEAVRSNSEADKAKPIDLGQNKEHPLSLEPSVPPDANKGHNLPPTTPRSPPTGLMT